MSSIQRILVPVDFSACSESALGAAMDLAAVMGAQVDVLHVWEPSPYLSPTAAVYVGDTGAPFWDQLVTSLDEKLGECVERHRAERPIACERFVTKGYPSSTINRELSERAYDLVVIGTHGRNWLAHVLLGSVAAQVVRNAPCPVLTVRAPEGEEK